MKPSETVKILATLAAAYFPEKGLPPSTLSLYGRMLAHLDAAEVEAAVDRLVVTHHWMPKISEILATVAELRLGLPDAEVAWGDVRAAVQKYGHLRYPVFECLEVDKATKMIGWATLCNTKLMAAERKRWIDTYNSLRRGRIAGEILGVVVEDDRTLPEAGDGPMGSPVLVLSSFQLKGPPRLRLMPGGVA